MIQKAYNLVCILGPTACGKTALAANLALSLNSCVISADSRQVYRNMDIGTGKDIDEYVVDGRQVPVHLIDICNAGAKYNVYEYQKDFFEIFTKCINNMQLPVLCGGTGLYIESVLSGYQLISVPVNENLRFELDLLPDVDLVKKLTSYGPLHNKSDLDTRKRTIRAIEIAEYKKSERFHESVFPQINSLIVGVDLERSIVKQGITQRLHQRLKAGMIEEVQSLLNLGVSADDLLYYGLEYKFITQYLTGVITYNEMVEKLNIAIHQFSKRQMTWFRKMERDGFKIHWLSGLLPLPEKLEIINKLLHEVH